MKIHHLIMLAIALLLAGCVNFERNVEFPDTGNEATQEETAEVELGTKTESRFPTEQTASPPPPPTETPEVSTPPAPPSPPSQPDAGSGAPAPAETVNPPPKSEPAGNLLETPDEGVLVKAPQNYTTKVPKKELPTYDPPIAQTVFVSPENHEYMVRVFRRRPEETLLDWGKHSSFGDAFLPSETIRSRDGNSGYVYETNDLGAIPDHHITLMTEGFVYRFDWDNPRLDWNALTEEIMMLIRNREEEFFPVPEHFKAFVRNVLLK